MKPTQKRRIKAYCVISDGELKHWWQGVGRAKMDMYDTFVTKIDAEQAKLEWGMPAKIVPCEIRFTLPKK
ncbi:MAG: hypothetical protein PHN89_05550 [Candidatus Pacebacteria bacterium]|nr:hypothetical protein [Candidatus Paceibacterota bacterium]